MELLTGKGGIRNKDLLRGGYEAQSPLHESVKLLISNGVSDPNGG